MSFSRASILFRLLWLTGCWLISRHQSILPQTTLVQPIIITFSWICCVTGPVSFKTWVRKRSSQLKDLPGPKPTSWLFGNTLDVFDDPLAHNLTKWINARPYPDGLMHFFGLFGSEYVIPTDHESLSDVLSVRSSDFEKTTAFRKYAIRFFGNGLVSQEQEDHRRSPKWYTTTLNQAAIQRFQPMVTDKSRRLMNRIIQICEALGRDSGSRDLKEPAVVAFTKLISSASLDTASSVAIGEDLETIQGKNLQVFEAFKSIFATNDQKKSGFVWRNILPHWMHWFIASEEESSMGQAHDLLVSVLRQKVTENLSCSKTETPQQQDFLVNLASSGGYNEIEHRAHLITILAAGYISLGGSLGFAIYCLAVNQNAQSSVRDEVIAAKRGRLCLSEGEYDTLPILNAMALESLRLYPSFPLLLRKAVRDTSTKGRFIPRGTYVGICPKAVNYARHIWGPDAEQFNIERWIDRSHPLGPKSRPTGGAVSPICMLSFGYGTRSCVGRNLALVQMKRQVAMLVEKLHVGLADDRVPRPTGIFTSSPPVDMRLQFVKLD